MGRFALLFSLAGLLGAGSAMAETFYLGTYTKDGPSQGIYRYELNEQSGAVTARGLAAAVPNPSYLVIHPNRKLLYAVSELDDQRGGACAFQIGADGSLEALNCEPALGTGSCHLNLDREERHLLVANYNTGSVAVLPLLPDGSLGKATGFMQQKGTGPIAERQEASHAHGVYVEPSNRLVLVPDLGVDKVFLYKFDPARGLLASGEPPYVEMPPGAGPRHLALGGGGIVYVANEMGNFISVLGPAGGGFKELQRVPTLPKDFHDPNTTAEIVLHPNGKTLYISNRGHDSIATYAVGEGGQLTLKGFTPTGGKTPRFIGLNPSGRILLAANQDSGNVVVFHVGPDGALTPAGVEFSQAQPVCVAFLD